MIPERQDHSPFESMIRGGDPLYDQNRLPVTVSGMWWRLNSVSSGRKAWLNWALCESVPVEVATAMVAFMRFKVATKSANHCSAVFSVLYKLTRLSKAYCDGGMRTWIFATLEDFRSRGWEWRFHYVRDWFRWCSDQQMDAFEDSELLYELHQIRIPGNRKGETVRSEDPHEGPLDEIEEAALRAALHRDQGPLIERALAWTLLALGCNPKNIVHLEERDFKTLRNGEHLFHSIDVPRIKKRADARAQFKTRKLDAFLAELFRMLLARNATLGIPTSYCRPLFARSTPRIDCGVGSAMEAHAYCFTSDELQVLLDRIVSRMNVASHRTGDILRVTPRRLRYTFATRKVQEGCSMEALAELLDHTDLQNVMVYYSGHGLSKRLNEALAVSVGPLVNRFMGRLVDDESDASDAGGRIKAQPMGRIANIGTCGSTTLCTLYPPASCYICPKFQPWRNAPHREVLVDLLQQRDARVQATGRADDRIAKQFDEMILAVGQVVALCEGSA